MKSEIEYVYNKLKQLRFDFKESDRKLFPNEYTFDYGLDRYVRVDGNDLYISKDTFKPLEEELEYADKCHNLEEQIDYPLDVLTKVIIDQNVYIIDLEDYRRATIKNGHIYIKYKRKDYILPFEDYGKTWLLKDKSDKHENNK